MDMGTEMPPEELEIPSRVHVMPLGFEEYRVYESAERLKADKVVLLVHADDDLDEFDEYLMVTDELDARGIEYEPVRCDLFGLYDSLGTFADVITNYPDDQVFVNVATGSKVTAIAGMIACMVRNATPYYAMDNQYKPDGDASVGEITKLPRYNIEAPQKEQVEIMEFIQEKEEAGEAVTKGDLIHEAERRQLPFITRHDVQEKGKYRLLDRDIINPLKQEGYIEVEKVGRNKEISLTDDGHEAIKAFRSLV